MKLKCIFEMVDMGEEVIGVPVGEGADQICGVLKLNHEGMEIIETLKTDTTEKKIIDVLALKYDNSRDSLEQYVHQFIQSLREENLIEE